MNEPLSAAAFVETVEYLRFTEFCDACRDFHYIGLCHGPPGVGKTLSARRYAKADLAAGLPPPQKPPLQELARWRAQHTVFHTAPVVTSPGGLGLAIAALPSQLHALLLEPLRREEEAVREAALELDRERQDNGRKVCRRTGA